MTIGIIVGSIRQQRAGASVGEWVYQQATEREAEYQLIDLKSFDVPLLDAPVVPGAADKNYDDERVSAWSKAIDACEGFIFITPEYNHSVPGAMKNAFDSLGGEWARKPVGYVGYGSAGAVRAVEHWRQITANFSMPNVRNQIDLNLYTEFGENGVEPNERRNVELATIFDDLEQLINSQRG